MNKSMRTTSTMSNNTKRPPAAPVAHRTVQLPSIPSNVGDDAELAANFNSIGYYGDLLSRLDSQISTVEDVYKQTFNIVQAQ